MKKINIICGATATGKSTLAIKEALKTNGIIINADSQQLYKELPVLTACPTEKDYKIVPHKLYQIINATDLMDVKKWLSLVSSELLNIAQNNQTPFIVGGTGFYISALINGLSPIPDINENIRKELRTSIQIKTKQELYSDLEEKDPILAKKLKPTDTQRVLRGLEVFLSTGKPLSFWQTLPKIKIIDNIKFNLKIVDIPKDELNQRILQRITSMLNNGAVEEVKALLKSNYPTTANIFKIIGVRQIEQYLLNKINKDELINIITLKTIQYAKRQRTFFKTQIL